MKSAPWVALAMMPPTFAAASTTYSGLSEAKNSSTAAASSSGSSVVRASEEIRVILVEEPTSNRGADHAAVAGDVDAGFSVHERLTFVGNHYNR